MNNSLIGVVMCGGESKRMGSDKGLLRQRGKSWASIAYEKLEHITPDVSLSINSNQLNSYRKIFPLKKLIADSVKCKGPLAGLLSAHKSKPESDILLLACDMVKMDIQTLKMLGEEYERNEAEHDFYVFRNYGEYEPLAGIYTSNGIEKVFSLYRDGALTKHSMKHILENGNTYAIDTTDSSALTNFNSPTDLSRQIAVLM